MSAYVDTHRNPPSRSPLRKPLPNPAQQPQHQSQNTRLQPLTKIVPDQQQQQHHQQQLQPAQPSHTHSRSASSSTLPSSHTTSAVLNQSQPYSGMPSNYTQPQYQQYTNQYPATTRRTLSNATTSTSSTNGGNRKQSFGGSTLQRTGSSRSGTPPTSYVALMRKQKATVWSDRAQHEDPRQLAQQRAAKMRAHMEVSGAHAGSGRMSTSGQSNTTGGGVRSKIRGHGAPKAQQYAPTTNPASGVPMRLSAREVDEDDDPEDRFAQRQAHHRSGSGRSSVGSSGRVTSLYGPGITGTGRSSEGGTPPQNTNPAAPPPPPKDQQPQQRGRGNTQESILSTTAEPTPVPNKFQGADYFEAHNSQNSETPGSDNSERENSFGNVAMMPHRVREVEEKKDDDLHRRGSVDERTSTMRGYGRLFVANPDLSD